MVIRKTLLMSLRKLHLFKSNQIPQIIRNSFGSARNCRTQINPSPFQPNVSAKESTDLIRGYLENGLFSEARHVFEKMPDRDVIAWTAMISGYVASNRHVLAWKMFYELMRESTDYPNAFTLSSTLKACKGMKSLSCGALVHGLALKHGLVGTNIYVDNGLLDMYATCCASMDHACAVFGEIQEKNNVSWTTLITGYAHRDDGIAALGVFRQMFEEEAKQSPHSISIAVRACAATGSCAYGKQIHAVLFKYGFDLNTTVMNSLLDMYCRCNCFCEANHCFNGMKKRDSITWNTLIAGYEKSNPKESVHLFSQMELQGCTPDCFTFPSVIAACTNLTTLSCGQQIHGGIFKRGLEQNVPLANSLINMYAKSGSIENSCRIFHEMSCRDLLSWTSMIIGFGSHGFGKEAIELFNEMVSLGMRLDRIVFVAVVSACSHAGLVDEGLNYFQMMIDEYKIRPDRETYGCVVDLLGRGGRVKEAYDMIKSMPFKPDESIWKTFLGACKTHGHPTMDQIIAQRVLDLRPTKTGVYVILANMYAAEGKWGDQAKMKKLLNKLGNNKEAGRSWVEVRDQICSFVAGDAVGSRLQPVYQVIQTLGQHMTKASNVLLERSNASIIGKM